MESMDSFIERLASPSPAPGGGAASASVALIASSLVSMVSGLTMGKKGYENAQESVGKILERSKEIHSELRNLMVEDEESFNRLFAAWKMPKTSDEEKAARKQKIAQETMGAIGTPWKIAEQCQEILKQATILAEIGNSSAITDAGSALEFSLAAIKGALLNVLVNLKSMSDSNYVNKEKERVEQFIRDSQRIYDEGMANVNRRM